jgi:LSD1 subclass zinc finger protein
MPKNPLPPMCSKCRKPMHFMLVKTGGRKFRCTDCDAPDLFRSLELQKLLVGELRSPK